MYKDALGTEIKIGHVIAVGRYGRRSSLDYGIVTEIKTSSKSTWIKFYNGYEYRAQVIKGRNRNVAIVSVSEKGAGSLNKSKAKLIADGILPAHYMLGESAKGLLKAAESSESLSNRKADDILSGLGAPKSLGGSK